MDFTSQYGRTLAQLRSRWSTYLLGYGGAIVLLIATALISLSEGWYSFVILALVCLLVISYFLAVSLWAYHALYDNNGIRDTLFEIGELGPTTTIVDLSLGLRDFPVALSRRLTTGKVIVVDVYNPLSAPNRALARAHGAAERPDSDPRLAWWDGSIGLLPLPDNSAQVVTLVEVISELWQEGDQNRLLQEVNRILRPGGTMLLAERVQTAMNLLVSGPGRLRRPPASHWLALIDQNGFRAGQSRSLRDLIWCLRADKLQEGETRPLPLDD